ncbi:MAG: DUF502 domain-containing protein [Desulfuromusa sp.]|nr:DUF502 domain-containing protein [Desulfuromusa sp.]
MKFIKTTIISGLIFLVPLVIVAALIGKAFDIMLLVAKPLDKLIPIASVGGIAMVNLLALLAIAVTCFIAGLIARSAPAKKVYASLDNLLMKIPGYAFIKGFTDGISNSDDAHKSLIPVLVQFDDNAQIGFEVERSDDGNVVVYLPGAPVPWSGSVVYFHSERVERLGISVAQAFSNIRELGRGSNRLETKAQLRHKGETTDANTETD